MGKVYRRQKTGIVVASGKITSVAEDRLSYEISTQSFNKDEKKYDEEVFKVCASSPLPEGFVLGAPATAVGYQNGPSSISANSVSVGNGVFDMEDLSVLSGFVRKAAYKDEKNEDGTPKLKRDGTPRKPHFDISILVVEDDKRVYHTVKVYDFANADGRSEIDRYKARFKDFVDPETTPIYATVATSPGQESTWESEKDGRVYQNYGCSHMGINSLDLEFLFERERSKAVSEQPKAPAPEQVPSPAPAPAPVAEAPAAPVAEAKPAQPVYGEEVELVADEELPFL